MANPAHDVLTLRSTTLASPTFRDVCQRMLFMEMKFPYISFQRRKLPGAKLLPILKGSPQIVSYIQSVSIDDGFNPKDRAWQRTVTLRKCFICFCCKVRSRAYPSPISGGQSSIQHRLETSFPFYAALNLSRRRAYWDLQSSLSGYLVNP
ncbi:hypothetical protein FA15DRAFT_665110 [Coprinopsis marcescibilis]|uniref:Uncharacterized protein n=1 Tax=Coprinopsis marcescibilis TaxID=230819 RepID=A0A5C3L6K7_COPMA|nr:hypothetical protein FA15DRAFT_665110 [Coprinopsis marcescibilis]